MRVYFTTAITIADAILRDGFINLYMVGDAHGVWLADRQLDCNEGFDGPVTLCLDVPDEEFGRYEWVEEGGMPGYRKALMPADVLNRLGKPFVYDHIFAGCSRRQLVQLIRRRKTSGRTEGYPGAQDAKDAIDLFDRIGWLTPVKLREDEMDEKLRQFAEENPDVVNVFDAHHLLRALADVRADMARRGEDASDGRWLSDPARRDTLRARVEVAWCKYARDTGDLFPYRAEFVAQTFLERIDQEEEDLGGG